MALVFALLFTLGAWPLLLVPLPPFQDLPNHLAAAYIAARPDLYPQYVFNGFLKSNSLFALWLYVAGSDHLFAAGKAFTAVVIAANAFGLPYFVLHFGGRRRMLVSVLFLWPLVHGFFLSLGMMNFTFAVPLAFVLLVALDRQRRAPSWRRASGIAALAALLWYAHPFPLVVIAGLVLVEAWSRPDWRGRFAVATALGLPLVPVGLLLVVTVLHHLIKAPGASTSARTAFAYLTPWELVLHFWLDASGAFTRWGVTTFLPAALLPYFAWKGRALAIPFFSTRATLLVVVAYAVLPLMLSNWWYLNCRLVPFLWAAFALRLPSAISQRLALALAACALWFSVALGVDYVRLDRDRAELTAGVAAVPMRATLLPLVFNFRKSSDFTSSLMFDWAYYVLERQSSAPLVFAAERSYEITWRVFPPAALIPPALDHFAEVHGTPARLCHADPALLAGNPADCTELGWRRQWEEFWLEAEPAFTHVLTWAMPNEARAVLPLEYHRVFAAGDLEIYARDGSSQ